MITLAAIAFLFAGLLFATYALRFTQVVGRRLKQPVKAFGYAYGCMAGALLIWGLAAANGSQPALNASVIAGNLLILVGSVFMLHVSLHHSKTESLIAIGLGSVGVVAFLAWRLSVYPPHPSLTGGILLFQTPLPVTVVLSLIIAGIWLPASLMVAKALTSQPRLRPLRQTYYAVYTMATVSALLFLGAKTPLIVVLTFAAVVLCFVMLMATTMLVDKIGKPA